VSVSAEAARARPAKAKRAARKPAAVPRPAAITSPGAALLPTRRTIWGLAALALLALLPLALGVPVASVGAALAACGVAALGVAALDLALTERAWRAAPPTLARKLPNAFALGVRRDVALAVDNPGPHAWTLQLFDSVDERLDFEGLPLTLTVGAKQQALASYTVLPGRRGRMQFAPAQARVPTRWGLFERVRHLGAPQTVRVFPNFAEVARFAWLAGDRRLREIGIKSYVQRGQGTDFKQLAEYRAGDDVRHIDWKATLRHRRPMVREFQDERDQCVLFLLDCGRRMRADEAQRGGEGSHFDQALNALMLLTHVALESGDEVGALTYGLPPQQVRRFAPRKGAATLNALMAVLHDVEPQAEQSDLQQAAQELMRLHAKRSLVVVITDVRDEDADEIAPALRLLRTRHLVLLASLRERALREVAEQPMTQREHATQVAAAHALAQARREAFRRLAGRDALLLDVEPEHLAVELVNRYREVKRSGAL
jgi:uncharacterized protein (DUF58 family)